MTEPVLWSSIGDDWLPPANPRTSRASISPHPPPGSPAEADRTSMDLDSEAAEARERTFSERDATPEPEEDDVEGALRERNQEHPPRPGDEGQWGGHMHQDMTRPPYDNELTKHVKNGTRKSKRPPKNGKPGNTVSWTRLIYYEQLGSGR